jgi:hypothetical protein
MWASLHMGYGFVCCEHVCVFAHAFADRTGVGRDIYGVCVCVCLCLCAHAFGFADRTGNVGRDIACVCVCMCCTGYGSMCNMRVALLPDYFSHLGRGCYIQAL